MRLATLQSYIPGGARKNLAKDTDNFLVTANEVQ
jgi:hypothetical protein